MRVQIIMMMLLGSLLGGVQAGWAQELLSFKGQVDWQAHQLDLVLHLGQQNPLTTRWQQVDKDRYHVTVDVDHMQTRLFNVATVFHADIELKHQEATAFPFLKAKVWTQYALLDYKPARDLSGYVTLAMDEVLLEALTIGGVKLDGGVHLASPYKVDLRAQLTQVPMDQFLDFWTSTRTYEATGEVSGKIKASGIWDNLLLSGQLRAQEGLIKNLDYETIVLNLEGIYPHLRVVDSLITKTDGVMFTLEGPINLLDKKNFKKQIKSLNFAPLVIDSKGEREWTIRRMSDETGVIDLKYMLRKDPASGTLGQEDSTMLGIERTMEF